MRPIVGGILGALATSLFVLARRPSRRQERARQAIAAVRAHALRFVWPGPIWPLPLPGKRRSVLGAVELGALWHVPAAVLGQLVATRSVRHLPTPAYALLDPDRDQAQSLPPPAGPVALGQRRLAISQARWPDGQLGLIGPTVRDLRQGMEILGQWAAAKAASSKCWPASWREPAVALA
jgi:hypothetical protein